MKTRSSIIGLVAPVPPPNGGMAIQGERLASLLTEDGFIVHVIPANPSFPGFVKLFEQLKGFRTVIRFILLLVSLRKLRHVDVVHILAASHLYFFAVVAPTILFSKLFGKRVILNYRGGEADSFFSKHGKWASPFLVKADVVAVPSVFLARVFQKHFSLKCHILPNIADFEIFHFRERVIFAPKIIVSRQLETIYGHTTILKGFAKIKKEFPDAVLKIAGEGSLRKELEKLTVDLALEDVEFLGVLTPQKLSEVYDDSDIMVNASTIDNFPGALIEAFVCGLPVVSSDSGGIPNMITDGKNGLLFAVDDDHTLADKVKEIVRSPDKARILVSNAKAFAADFSWPVVRHELLHLYDFKT